MMPGSTTIYGLYDRRGRCRYVGGTRWPYVRQGQHKKRFRSFRFREIRECDGVDALRIEYQIIRALKRRGQADKNIATRSATPLRGCSKRAIYLRGLRISRGYFSFSVAEYMGINPYELTRLETGARKWTPALERRFLKTIHAL